MFDAQTAINEFETAFLMNFSVHELVMLKAVYQDTPERRAAMIEIIKAKRQQIKVAAICLPAAIVAPGKLYAALGRMVKAAQTVDQMVTQTINGIRVEAHCVKLFDGKPIHSYYIHFSPARSLIAVTRSHATDVLRAANQGQPVNRLIPQLSGDTGD